VPPHSAGFDSYMSTKFPSIIKNQFLALSFGRTVS